MTAGVCGGTAGLTTLYILDSGLSSVGPQNGDQPEKEQSANFPSDNIHLEEPLLKLEL